MPLNFYTTGKKVSEIIESEKKGFEKAKKIFGSIKEEGKKVGKQIAKQIAKQTLKQLKQLFPKEEEGSEE